MAVSGSSDEAIEEALMDLTRVEARGLKNHLHRFRYAIVVIARRDVGCRGLDRCDRIAHRNPVPGVLE